jgi:hypothetical protein
MALAFISTSGLYINVTQSPIAPWVLCVAVVEREIRTAAA